MAGKKQFAVGAVALALVFVGVGCGGSDAGDKLAEKIAEKNSGGDVNIDSDKGKVSYTDENGNKSEIDVSGGAKLPDGWPDELAPPDSVKIVTSSTNTTAGKKTMTVLGEAKGSIDDFTDPLKSQIEDAGYTIENDSSTSGAGGGYVGISAKGADYDLVATITDGSDGKVNITMTLAASGS